MIDTEASTTRVPEVSEQVDRLRLSATRLARLLRQQSEPGLTPTQLAALATIARSGPLPIGALAEEEQVSPPTATKIVDKLHEASLVERRRDPTDRRVALVAITSTGRERLAAIRERKTAWLTRRLEALPERDRADLAAAIHVLESLTAVRRDDVDDDPQDGAAR